ncbi:hypothetical protein [Komagataeibacter diospyri]|uniref:hypothetical protein n=1 Tax=Komagataeibacter diospyri TaxID=1932662 RepID=UPI00139699ED|nr:hypothetical protein [Komagataeibacter diospyri]
MKLFSKSFERTPPFLEKGGTQKLLPFFTNRNPTRHRRIAWITVFWGKDGAG